MLLQATIHVQELSMQDELGTGRLREKFESWKYTLGMHHHSVSSVRVCHIMAYCDQNIKPQVVQHEAGEASPSFASYRRTELGWSQSWHLQETKLC